LFEKSHKYERGGACNTHVDKRNVYRNLLGRPEGKKPLGRPRRRWEDNIKIDVGDIGWDGMDWVDMAEDRDQWRTTANTVHGEPSGFIKFREILDCLSDRRLLKKGSAPWRLVRKATDIFRCQPVSTIIFTGIKTLEFRTEVS
jgi:hypothetical protein